MISVLSGDIIQSESLKGKVSWTSALKEVSAELASRFEVIGSGGQIFQGDGFQIGLKNPEDSLLAAILIRAGLLKTDPELDARIAIGIGPADSLKNNILESDGEAFRLSGRLLSKLKKNKQRLALSCPFSELNAEMEVSLRFLGIVIDDWSQADAETAWLSWMKGMNQKQIQQQLGISQPAVSKRKSSARLDEIQIMLDRFNTLIKKL